MSRLVYQTSDEEIINPKLVAWIRNFRGLLDPSKLMLIFTEASIIHTRDAAQTVLIFEDQIVLPGGRCISVRLDIKMLIEAFSDAGIERDVKPLRMVVDMKQRKVFYHGIVVASLPPRDLICLCILAQHPGVALPVKTIYQMAIQQGIDGGRFDVRASLPMPKAIRFAIRNALHRALEAERKRPLTSQEEMEIQDILDSRRDGTITLQILKDEISVVGLPNHSLESSESGSEHHSRHSTVLIPHS